MDFKFKLVTVFMVFIVAYGCYNKSCNE